MIILQNGTVLGLDPPVVQHGTDVVIEGGTIKEVGSDAAEKYLADTYPAAERIDCTGKLVWPGLVCSHNHFYSGLARGILADIKPSTDFVTQLQNLWWKLDRAIDEEILTYSGLISSLEAIKAGTTAVIDHHSSQSFITGSLGTLKKGFETAGLRGITCFEVTDRNGEEGMRLGVDENLAFIESLASEEEGAAAESGGTAGGKGGPQEASGPAGLVRGMIGGHAPFTIPDTGLELLAGAAEKTGTGLHIHAGEDRYDQSRSHAVYGKDLIARLDDFGLITDKTIFAHGIYFTDADIEAVNRRDAFLVHNVRSNMNNSVGYNTNLHRLGNVALGTDGIGSNMYEEGKFAFFKNQDEGAGLGFGDILGFLWKGNRLLERNFGGLFGKIEPGYTADIVISSYDPPTPLVPENIAGHFIFGMSSRDVETVIINGKRVYEERRFLRETAALYKEAQAAAKRLWERMDELQ